MESDHSGPRMNDPTFLAGVAVVAIAFLGLLSHLSPTWAFAMFGVGNRPMSVMSGLAFLASGFWLCGIPQKGSDRAPLLVIGTIVAVLILTVTSSLLGWLPPSNEGSPWRMSPTTVLLFSLAIFAFVLQKHPWVPVLVSVIGFLCATWLTLVPEFPGPIRAEFLPADSTGMTFLCFFAGIFVECAPRVHGLAVFWSDSRWAGLLRSLVAGLYFIGMAGLVRQVFLSGLGASTPYITFFPAIVLATVLADTLAGGVAIAGAVSITLFSILKGHPSSSESLAIGLFILSSTFILALADGWRRALGQRASSESRERQHQAHLKALLATVPDLVWLKDTDGVYLVSNRRHRDYLGATEPQVLGKKDSDFVSPGLSEAFRKSDLEVMTTGEPTKTEREVTFANDGHREYLEVLKAPIRDNTGAIIGVLGVGRDITQYRLMIEELALKEERFRLAIDGSRDSVWDWDLASGQVYRSPNWWTILGYGEPQSSAAPDNDPFVHEEDRKDLSTAIRLATTGRETFRVEARYLRADGTWRWIESRGQVSAVDQQGRPSRISGISSDIQARKDAEQEREQLQTRVQQAQKMEGLGHLASGVAHDMNNVLGAVLGQASLGLLPPVSTARATKSLESIVDAAKRGANLIRGLLEFSRRSPQEREVVNFNDIVREEVRFLAPTALAKTRFVLDLDEGLHSLRGDRDALRNVLMNLCLNAIDAIDSQGEITIRSKNLNACIVEVTVSDNGSGMSAEVLAKAADPFFTTKPVGKGTGLGLALVFTTVQNHGGNVTLASTPSRGTTVTIHLPAIEKTQRPEEQGSYGEVPNSKPLGILLIDDDPLIREAGAELLSALGHHVVVAASGEAGLVLLEEHPVPDVIILDLTMPGLGGRGTLAAIRKARPNLPVVLATGLVDEETYTWVGQQSRVTLLGKPYDVGDLQRALLENQMGDHLA